MKNNPLMQLMAQSLNADATDGGSLPTLEAQADLLDSFLGEFSANAAALQVGDPVTRNRLGEQRYRYPADGQLARVSHVFDHPRLDENAQLVHGEIAVVQPKGRVTSYTVDFRYMQRAE